MKRVPGMARGTHGERADTDLSLALGDRLTMVNRGFVQALCLRFDGERMAAELAYGDNLAETRRLMQLIRAMQRESVVFGPDGTAELPISRCTRRKSGCRT